MFKLVLKLEIKNVLRDKMYKFFVLYPLILGVVALFLMPYLESQGEPLALYIVTLIFILMNGFLFGAVSGFTLLDDRDDHVITSLKVSPIPLNQYVLTKLILTYMFGVASTVFILIMTNFLDISNLSTFTMIALLSPMQGPMVALLINLLSSNKVEGFVIMKSAGVLMLVPIAAIFLTDWKEIFLYVVPGFWPGKLVLNDLMGAHYFLGHELIYFFLGLLVTLSLTYLLFRLYMRKMIVI